MKSSLVESFIKKAKEFTKNSFSILFFEKNGPSLNIFLEEEKELFNKMNNYFQKINNNLKNNEAILEKKNEELNEIINKLKLDLEKEKEIN